MSLPFPKIDPVAFAFDVMGHHFEVHWYALAYVGGFLLGWRVALYLTGLYKDHLRPNREDIDDFITWAILGVLFGGRIGYVLFYNLPAYMDQPLEALKVWHGGMSFHGGALGVIAALILYAKVKHVSFLRLADIATTVVPIGLLLGRVANFINGELYGRVTESSWGVMFPQGGPDPRHPSQLYEAVMEGLVLFVILFALMHVDKVRRHQGVVAGAFLLLYGVFRFCIEFFREPDVQLGFLFDQVTMGQILCIPMIVIGASIVVWRAKCKS
ncbi:MAG: prolipoprotein diacylglyceryl transferase [Alphaproteobacteria bacterium CG1_02_46_17]|nr:MAG: prolipoprotein diacylglyceryl transferase [Alphaproteobacteria bacterium CG1_02_46_17]